MKLASAALALVACSNTTGNVAVTLVTAPGSHVLDPAVALRVILTNPHQVSTASRTASGFSIELDLPAADVVDSLIVDALDASSTVIATGASPPFPISAINAAIAVYMAAPGSIAASPVMLSPARSAVATGALSYGVVLAGGSDASGAASDAIAIYNAYDHSIGSGLPLPAPHTGLALGVGSQGVVDLFGGDDATGAATATMWQFVSTVAPMGAYAQLGDKTGFARTGALAVPISQDVFMLTGTPAAVMSGLDGSVTARPDIAGLPDAGATVLASDGLPTSVFAGPGGVVRFRNDTFDTPAIPDAARPGASVVALPGGKLAVVCGGPDLVSIDALSEVAVAMPGIPSAVRSDCATAATPRHLVIAGGTLGDGTIASTAEIYDSTSLALLATQPLVVPRTKATATVLPNGQILIAGGVDATGAPTATLELFTPPSTE